MMNRHHQDENETHSYREKEMEFQCLYVQSLLANHNAIFTVWLCWFGPREAVLLLSSVAQECHKNA
jgi:hypothetical protein